MRVPFSNHLWCVRVFFSTSQENATLLAEEGRLLASVQGTNGADYFVDGYTSRLEVVCAHAPPPPPVSYSARYVVIVLLPGISFGRFYGASWR